MCAGAVLVLALAAELPRVVLVCHLSLASVNGVLTRCLKAPAVGKLSEAELKPLVCCMINWDD